MFDVLGHMPRRADVAKLPGFEIEGVDVSGACIAEVGCRRVHGEVGDVTTAPSGTAEGTSRSGREAREMLFSPLRDV